MGWLGSIAGGVLEVGKFAAGLVAENAGAIIGGATTMAGASMMSNATNKTLSAIPTSLPKEVEALKEEVPNVEDASKLATAKIKEKRKDINRSRTIFSSPLGQIDEADISVKTLLGK